MKKILFITVVAFATMFISSCEKDEVKQEPIAQKNEAQISDINSIPSSVLNEMMIKMGNNAGNKPNSGLKASYDPYGTYPFLSNTGNGKYQFLLAKTYAAKITRSWYNGTLYYSAVFRAENVNATGTLYAHLYDQNWKLLSYNSYSVDAASANGFRRIPIAGSNQLIIFFTANVAGNYMTWYDTIF